MDGEQGPDRHYDPRRSLTVTDDGVAVVDLAFSSDTVTVTKAIGEHDDSDRDDNVQTVTMVEAEGFDHSMDVSQAVWAGTITMTRAEAEADDADDELVARFDARRFAAFDSETGDVG